MDRQRLESSATFAALVLLAFMLFSGIIGIADGVFNWDLLTDGVERVAMFVLATNFLLLVSCVLVSVMLNLSIIAQRLSEAVGRERTKD